MKKNFAVFPALVMGFAALAQSQAPAPTAAPSPAPTKVGIIYAANAIASTKEGTKALEDLGKKFQPKKDAIDKKNAEIQSKQDQIRKGTATLSAEARQKLQNDIESLTKSVNRDTEDAQAEWDEAQGKLMQELGNKMMEVLSKYAGENGFAVILDVSNQQTPVLWAAPGVEITKQIIDLYDQKYPIGATTSAAPAGTAAKPAAAPAGTARPTAPAPAGKKQ